MKMAYASRKSAYDVSVIFVVGLCIIIVQQPAEAGFDRHCTGDSKQVARGVCGKTLSGLLEIVCRPLGGYNKRHAADIVSDDVIVMSASNPVDDDRSEAVDGGVTSKSVFLPKTLALSYLKYQRSPHGSSNVAQMSVRSVQSRGIICECCIHQCGLGELIEYCQDRPIEIHSQRGLSSAPAST